MRSFSVRLRAYSTRKLLKPRPTTTQTRSKIRHTRPHRQAQTQSPGRRSLRLRHLRPQIRKESHHHARRQPHRRHPLRNPSRPQARKILRRDRHLRLVLLRSQRRLHPHHHRRRRNPTTPPATKRNPLPLGFLRDKIPTRPNLLLASPSPAKSASQRTSRIRSSLRRRTPSHRQSRHRHPRSRPVPIRPGPSQIFTDHRLWFDALGAYDDLIAKYPDRPELYDQRGAIYAQIPATKSLSEADFARADKSPK